MYFQCMERQRFLTLQFRKMISRVRRPLQDSQSTNLPLNRSQILNRHEVEKAREEENRIMKKSTFINKSTSNTRMASNPKLEIAVSPDLNALREYTTSTLAKGLNTNKASLDPTLIQRELHNENVNILNKKKEIVPDPEEEIISEAVTADGKQMIVSRALKGRLLARATIEELNQNLNEKKKVFPLLVPANSKLINYEPTKASVKSIGTICSYAANTNQGISRNYNEDRVSIILNISKKSTKCSFFAIYDGHGGSSCCDYLRDALHDHIINHPSFPESPREALAAGVREAEQAFLQYVRDQSAKDKKLDRSGSCGIITLIVGEECYVANIGDSRAVLSSDSGKFAYNLSRDHKPTDPHEQKRIEQAGGKIYKTEIRSLVLKDQMVAGPLRVFPGKLSVSRTFGDIEAKDEKLGGNPKVVVVEPQIKHFNIKANHDFIVLGSDGVFDKMESKDVVKVVWQTVEIFKDRNLTIHELLSVCVEEILREVMNRRSLDNITVVMIAFKNFENTIAQMQQERNAKEEKRKQELNYRTK